jgi:hypothetical protein
MIFTGANSIKILKRKSSVKNAFIKKGIQKREVKYSSLQKNIKDIIVIEINAYLSFAFANENGVYLIVQSLFTYLHYTVSCQLQRLLD